MKEKLKETVIALCDDMKLSSKRGVVDNIDNYAKGIASLVGCYCSIKEQEIHEEFHLNMEAQMKDYIPGEDLLGKN